MTLKKYTQEFGYNFKLAYPIILAMLGHTIVGIIDNIMVGKIGATQLAAASLANSFVFIALSIGVGFSSAITPLVAAADTENDTAKGRSVFINGVFLCTVLGLILFALLYFFKPFIDLMNQPDDVAQMSKPFLDIVALSLVPLVIFQGFKQFADGKSQTKYSMYATIIANIINVLFNYLLIYGVWIFPEMGMMGAAYGTLISRVVMLVYFVYIMYKLPAFKIYLEKIAFKEINLKMSKYISAIGIPSSMQSLFEVALFTGAVWLSGMLGTSSQAANQIALSMASMTFMFASGLSVAAMIRVGNQKGLKDYVKMETVAKSIMLMTLILYSGFALFFVLFHNYIPLLFLDNTDISQAITNQEVIDIAGKLLLIAAIFQISDGIQVTALGALRGLQDVNLPMIITFISYWVIGFPLCVYLGLYTPLQAEGIWYGLLAGLTVAAIFSYLRFHFMSKRYINNNIKI
ncbi:MATE family efflux transporter [Flavobacterium sp. CBA20B-1]|uniref:MATE family efflux transporter n=1 Tax=unclassified Flavobacterium TaxID=196869 RepID=UPI002224B9D2|nr:MULTISPECIES: MATE family efflux transporter [unclassified Flavobacterium]WCM42732.1 MATE family efflux transporter [Flavobacterium sp. CBA20B-1]